MQNFLTLILFSWFLALVVFKKLLLDVLVKIFNTDSFLNILFPKWV